MSDINKSWKKPLRDHARSMLAGIVIVVLAAMALATTACSSDSDGAAETAGSTTSSLWPENELLEQLPTISWPDADAGSFAYEFTCDADSQFICVIAASADDFDEYVAACKAAGFTADSYEGSTYYWGNNAAGYELSLSYDEDSSYYETSVMWIYLYAPEEEDEALDDTDADEVAEDTDEADGASDDASDTAEASDSTEVDPELAEWLDAYEAFMDSYVDFMLEYEDASDDEALDMLADYTEMLAEYAEFAAELEEWDTDEMSTADLAYYLEVTARIEERLAELYE